MPYALWLTLDEALDLLADLEDVRDALSEGNELVLIINVERHIVRISNRLGFDDPEG